MRAESDLDQAHAYFAAGSWRDARDLLLAVDAAAFLPAMEIAMLAVHEAGGDVHAILSELNRFFVPVVFAGALAFGLGLVGFVLSLAHGRLLSPPMTRFVCAALLILAASRFVPFGAALYVGGVGGVLALWPIAHRMWRCAAVGTHPQPTRSRTAVPCS